MDGVEICVILVVVCIIWAVVQFAIDLEKKEQQKQRKKDTSGDDRLTVYNDKIIYPSRVRFGDENIYGEKRDYQIPEDEKQMIQKWKIQNFWYSAVRHAYRYVGEDDLESLNEFMSNIWNTRDPVESAKDLHVFTESVIMHLYPKREWSEQHTETLVNFCYLVLSNTDNYLSQIDSPPVWQTPTKLAILLEKENRISEAIQLCDFCIDKDIPDYGYDSFVERKQHLLKKTRR